MSVIYYLDTSALVKRYHPERGTPYLDTVFAEADATFIREGSLPSLPLL
jgi:hypothetical protein